jgi:hypothetical protein
MLDTKVGCAQLANKPDACFQSPDNMQVTGTHAADTCCSTCPQLQSNHNPPQAFARLVRDGICS